MPLSGHRRQPCGFKQQVYPRADKTGPLSDHRVLLALVETAVALQKIEGFQGAPVHGEQFAPDGKFARPDRGREITEIEQLEVAGSRAGADEPAGCKEVVVAEAALQRTINENVDHCASVPIRSGGYIALYKKG